MLARASGFTVTDMEVGGVSSPYDLPGGDGSVVVINAYNVSLLKCRRVKFTSLLPHYSVKAIHVGAPSLGFVQEDFKVTFLLVSKCSACRDAML